MEEKDDKVSKLEEKLKGFAKKFIKVILLEKKVVDLESNLKKEVKKNDILSEKLNKMETTQKDYESKSFKCAQYDQNYVTYVENCLKVRKK